MSERYTDSPSGLNNITVVGNVGSVTRRDSDGKQSVRVTVCVNVNHRGEIIEQWYAALFWKKDDQSQEAFNRLANALQRAKVISLAGELVTRAYVKNDDARYTSEIIRFRHRITAWKDPNSGIQPQK